MNQQIKTSLGVAIIIIFAATILQKLFFKYVFRSAEDEDPKAAKKREKARLKAEARELAAMTKAQGGR